MDYQSGLGDWEREYAYALCRWMAIRVGKKKTRFTNLTPPLPTLPDPAPYIVYDGYESWPVLVGTKVESKRRPKNAQWLCTDKLGIKNGPEAISSFVRSSWDVNGFWEIHDKIVSEGEPMPEKGDRHAWHDKVYLKLYEKIKTAVDTKLAFLRKELTRLDRLWKATLEQ